MFPGLQTFPEGQILAFALVFLRALAFFLSWPLFSGQVPVSAKVLFSLILSAVIFPTLHFQNAQSLTVGEEIIFFAAREIIMGLFLGYLIKMFLFAVSIAGELVGLATGLASAQVFNPLSGVSSNVLEQFHVFLATAILLSMNGHHLFIQGFVQSYELSPISAVGFHAEAMTQLIGLGGEILTIGVKMAAPVTCAVLLANLAMGILGRAVPQLNIFVTSLQVTIFLGLVVFFVGLPLFSEDVGSLLQLMSERMFQVLKVI